MNAIALLDVLGGREDLEIAFDMKAANRVALNREYVIDMVIDAGSRGQSSRLKIEDFNCREVGPAWGLVSLAGLVSGIRCVALCLSLFCATVPPVYFLASSLPMCGFAVFGTCGGEGNPASFGCRSLPSPLPFLLNVFSKPRAAISPVALGIVAPPLIHSFFKAWAAPRLEAVAAPLSAREGFNGLVRAALGAVLHRGILS